MFSTIVQQRDHELISKFYKLTDLSSVEYDIFKANKFEKQVYQTLYHSKEHARNNVIFNFREKALKKLIDDCEYKFSAVTKYLNESYKSYQVEHEKVILGKPTKITVGSNVLTKTEDYYKIAKGNAYSGLYEGYRLLTISEIVGISAASLISKDSTIIDEADTYKWIPYLFNFEIPTFDGSDDDDKLLSLLTKNISREEFQEHLTENFLSMFEHPLLESFKVIVDTANTVTRIIGKERERIIAKLDRMFESLKKEVEHAYQCEENTRTEVESLKAASEIYNKRRQQFNLILDGKFYHDDFKKNNLNWLINSVNGTKEGGFMSLEVMNNYWLPYGKVIDSFALLSEDDVRNVRKFCILIDQGRDKNQEFTALMFTNTDRYPFQLVYLKDDLDDNTVNDIRELGLLVKSIVTESKHLTAEDLEFVINFYSGIDFEVAFEITKPIEVKKPTDEHFENQQYFYLKDGEKPVLKKDVEEWANKFEVYKSKQRKSQFI
jgi:hypothetical protein